MNTHEPLVMGPVRHLNPRAPSRPLVALLMLTLASLVLSGCTHLGPGLVKADRNDYNVSLQNTNDEQLLLNLVRLRYRDTPMFLEVSSVATQFVVNTGISASHSFQTGPDTTGLSSEIGYTEQPTVSYTPLQGEDFVQRLLAPIDLDTVRLMYHSGWSIERVLRLTVQRVNGLENAPSASGPTPSRAPRFEAFLRAATLLRNLQLEGALEFGAVESGGGTYQALRVDPASADRGDVQELTRMLGLDPGRPHYRIGTYAKNSAGGELIGITTRSLMGTLFFLSQSVEVPAADVQAGRVTTTLSPDGEPFDWGRVTGGLFAVHSASERPGNTAVAVNYRGSWFYVDDSDLDSKSTFSLLSQLFALQAGKAKGTAPTLTLPIGR